MMKRTLSLLLALVMVVGLLPGNLVWAADANDQIYIDESASLEELEDLGVVDMDIPEEIDIPEEELNIPMAPQVPDLEDYVEPSLIPDAPALDNIDDVLPLDSIPIVEEPDEVVSSEQVDEEESGVVSGELTGSEVHEITVSNSTTSYVWKADATGTLVENGGLSQTTVNKLSGGTRTITIFPADTVTTETTLHINLKAIQLEDGANLTVSLDDTFKETSVTEVVIHANAGDVNMFHVTKDSSLTIQGLSSNCRIVLSGADKDGNAVYSTGENINANVQLISLNGGSSLNVDYAAFRYAYRSAIRINGTVSSASISNTKFENTCQRTGVNATGDAISDSTAYGAAIYVSSGESPKYTKVDELSITDCEFDGVTSEKYGGAVCLYATVNTVEINGCTFSDVKLTGDTYGGAIAFIGIFEQITVNSTFNNCEAETGRGGAIAVRASVGELSIGSTFNGCTSNGVGGALYVITSTLSCRYVDTGDTYVADKVISRYSRINTLNITGSSFKNCSAGSQGGAVYLSAQINEINIKGTTFDNCRSTNGGGGIFFGTESRSNTNNWTEASEFGGASRDVVSTYWGGKYTTIGAVSIGDNTKSDGTVVHTTFTDCTAGTYGGAFVFEQYACADSLTVENASISGCQAVTGGGAVYFSEGVVPTVGFTNCIISGCQTTGSSGNGAIGTHSAGTMVLTMTGCTFSGNTSAYSGGGLYWKARSVRNDLSGNEVSPKATLTRCTFSGNTATNGYGGGVLCRANMTVIDCDFLNNTARRGGGIALRIDADGNPAMTGGETTSLSVDSDTVIEGNHAEYGGGVIVQANATTAISDSSTIGHTISFTLNGTEVCDNTAENYGGGICFWSLGETAEETAEVARFVKTVSIQNADIHDNEAGCYGGGLYLRNGDNTSMEVKDSYIYSNTCGTVGRYWDDDAIENEDGTTTGAWVLLGGHGGAIFVVGTGNTVPITNCVIGAKPAAAATDEAEATYTAAGNRSLKYFDMETDRYYGGGGAGVVVTGGARVILTGGRVVNNWSDRVGGGIYIGSNASVHLRNSLVDSNRACYGGGIYAQHCTGNSAAAAVSERYGLYVDGGTISNNLVKYSDANLAMGGGIYLYSANIRLVSVDIKNNEAKNWTSTGTEYSDLYLTSMAGGGICVSNGSILDIDGGEVSGNKANLGGGFYISDGSTVTMNPITDGDNTEIEDCLIDNNWAFSHGGGIYVASVVNTAANTLTVREATISNNRAEAGHGGGIHVHTGNILYLYNCDVFGNYVGLEITDYVPVPKKDEDGNELKDENGNTIYEVDENGNIVLEPVEAYGYGGGIYFSEATGYIYGGHIHDNDAERRGGGMYIDTTSNVTVAKGTFNGEEVTPVIERNTARDYAGGIGAVNADVKLILRDGEVKNNTAGLGGGGIYVSSDATAEILGATLQENTTNGSGGGIFSNILGHIVIDGGTITQNHALKGGGVHVSAGSDVTLKSGIISYNTADSGAGILAGATALYGGSDVIIQGGQVIHNTATGNGGGVYATGADNVNKDLSSYVEITGGLIDNNTAGTYGGGVYATRICSVTISDGHITNNTASSWGGGVCGNQVSTVVLNGGTIAHNTAGNAGGIGVLMSAKVTVNNGTIEDNTAQAIKTTDDNGVESHTYGNGGGIAGTGTSEILVVGGTIKNNKAHRIAYQVITENEDGTITKTTSYGGGAGGGIYAADGVTITLGLPASAEPDEASDASGDTAAPDETTETLSIIENVADSAGGGIYASGTRHELKNDAGETVKDEDGETVYYYNHSTIIVNAGKISKNQSLYSSGGGIYTSGTTNQDGSAQIILNGGEISENEAYNYGGGIYTSGYSCATLNSGTISGNIARLGGGGISAASNSTITVIGGTITGNNGDKNSSSSYGLGGGIHVYGSSTVTMEGGSITSNNARVGAGIYAADGTTVTLDDGAITGNTARSNGGGIYADGASGRYATLTINGGTISQNTVSNGNGGGIFTGGLSVTAEDGTTFYPAENSAHVTINGGEIFDNTANGNGSGLGGGLYSSGGSVVTIENGKIYNNHARNGGGVYANWFTNLTINNGEIYNHTIDSGNGAGVYVHSKTIVTINGGLIRNNTTNSGGGAGIYVTSEGNLTIEGGKICNNTTNEGNGGGINATQNAQVTVNGGEISGNTALSSKNGLGGGLILSVKAKIFVNGGSIVKNQSRCGGGIYATGSGSEITVSGGKISENVATIGGGIYATGISLTKVQGGEVSYNTAKGSGGGIFIGTFGSGKDTNAQVQITAAEGTVGKIMENTAYNGGGIYVGYNGTLTVTGGHIINNQAIIPKGKTPSKTGYQQTTLYGAGGGICVVGNNDLTATFTLADGDMAIYGNQAGFAGDEVFSNGLNTKLTVPLVSQMNLSGYELDIVGWFEDYNTGDTKYAEGLNRKGLTSGNTGSVKRYRNSTASERQIIADEYVDGSGLASGTQYVNLENTYVAMALGIPFASNDTIVVDYNLSVDIDILANDMLIKSEGQGMNPATDSKLGLTLPNNVAADKEILYSSISEGNHGFKRYLTTDEVSTINLELGTANWKKEGNAETGVLTYTMKKMKMDTEEVFYYVVPGERFYYYATVTVVPATSIYYEDNCGFVTYHKTTNAEDPLAEWEPVPGATENGTQDQDRPGMSAILEGLDADNIYGYDSSYATSSTYSGGAAHRVEVTKAQGARASFTFTGTGFDVISLCSNTTGLVLVNVFRGEVTDFNDPKIYNEDTYVVSYFVDTYYGYKYENGEWVVDPNADSTFYQVPVIKSDLTNVVWSPDDPSTPEDETVYKNFGYDTYTVELVVGTSWTPGAPNYDNAEFYLDAIRIYNPAGIGGSKSEVIQDVYLTDGEAWPAYRELRDMFIDQTDLKDNDTLNGILFIDGKDPPTLKDYKFWGPNNEVYLNPGQSIAFTMDTKTYGQNVAGIHMGMRGLTGLGNVTVQAGEYRQTDDGTVELVDVVTIIDNKVLSTTDLYYDISAKTEDGEIAIADKVVVITNSSPVYKLDENGNQVLDENGKPILNEQPIAISNLKVTHTTAPSSGIDLTPIFGNGMTTSLIALEILTPKQLTDPVVTPKRPALSFNGMVCYNVFFTAEELGDLTAADLGLAVFDSYDPEGTVDTAKDVVMGATQIDGEYMVATNGIHAKYLGDTQYFRVFAKKADGTYVYSKMVGYSAVDYAKNALANSNDVKLKQLVVAMLNYGAEAQKFFGYKVGDLMNKDLTADDQALLAGFDASSLNAVGKVDASKVGTFVSTGGFTKRSPAISFKGAFEINYFFTPANAVDGDMTLYFWNEDTYNSVTELTAENADKAVAMTLENGTYTASSDEIAAKYLDKTVYVAAVYESDGVTYCSGVLPYSIAAYCQKPPAGVQDLATAAAVYGCTAKQYFGV